MRRSSLVAALLVLALAAGASVAWASSLTVTSKQLGESTLSAPVMYPVSVTTVDGDGTVGRVRQGDRITFVWSQQIDEPTLCSGWSNTSSSQTLSMTWTGIDGTASDDLLKPGSVATCVGGLHVGTFDLGASSYFNSGTVTYSGSTTTLTVGATTTTLTVTLGSDSGSTQRSSGGTAGTWTPDPAVKDRSGNTCGANLATTTGTVMF
jgi:chitinase